MRGVACALLAIAPLVAGCASSGEECRAPFPLVLQAYPQVLDPSLIEIQTTLWNCTDGAIALRDPCGARDGLMPSVVVEGRSYFLALGDTTARSEDSVSCLDSEAPTRASAEPGDYLQQRYLWDGTYASGADEARPVADGAYVVQVSVPPLYASKVVEVPW